MPFEPLAFLSPFPITVIEWIGCILGTRRSRMLNHCHLCRPLFLRS